MNQPVLSTLRLGDDPDLSRAVETEVVLPSRDPKSCEKPARPMVSRLEEVHEKDEPV